MSHGRKRFRLNKDLTAAGAISALGGTGRCAGGCLCLCCRVARMIAVLQAGQIQIGGVFFCTVFNKMLQQSQLCCRGELRMLGGIESGIKEL